MTRASTTGLVDLADLQVWLMQAETGDERQRRLDHFMSEVKAMVAHRREPQDWTVAFWLRADKAS